MKDVWKKIVNRETGVVSHFISSYELTAVIKEVQDIAGNTRYIPYLHIEEDFCAYRWGFPTFKEAEAFLVRNIKSLFECCGDILCTLDGRGEGND